MKVLILCAVVFGLASAAKLPHQSQQKYEPLEVKVVTKQQPLKVVTKHQPLDIKVVTVKEEEIFPPQPYNFGFEVRDDYTTNYQNRAEVADEAGRVKGSYSYVLPDGYVYTVTYEDKKDGNGLTVVVKKEPSGIEVIIPEPYIDHKEQNLVRGSVIPKVPEVPDRQVGPGYF